MDALAEAVRAGASAAELERIPVPAAYTAAHTLESDAGMFKGVADKDVRRSIRVGEVPMPELAPDEVLVAVMASSINYNTVWSAMFEPLPTFAFLRRYGVQDRWAARHDQPHHVLGSDASGVVVRVGSVVRRWKPGDRVVVAPAHVDDHEPATHADGMLGEEQRAWGFETNFGGLAHYAVVRASQLLPKPAHLTWEEAAANLLCMGTAYRMLVSDRGARIKQGDIVLIWGAAGGLGAYAAQFVRNGGGIPVGVVGSEEKAERARALGCEVVINREEIGLSGRGGANSDNAIPDPAEAGRKLGRLIRNAVGEDPHIVFEHVGRATFGISVFVVRRGGSVVTCGSSTGYQHEFDNRYLWMRLKRVIGSHGGNLAEMAEANRLVAMGRIHPALSEVFPLTETGEAARLVQRNAHSGKVGVLCLAEREGLGVTDQALRDRIGERAITPLRHLP
ncbi:crotonyl-CoA carboxylase/reductase [Streptomyces sp. DSM 44917]|uniref:Crotonyl-CoA carboxylase/reductase n=1 Tax=Streptomyces boetiae TaxID=3075541 RepID=A0ABU2L493_9ACTN|nr:crotonyl-CoA carboxylase/reductase [Streptomyces sp. DSM 44917]MDT0306378.1 crotonyl-CoA carboxylase/reductase [Streptomyces sp. DSM 44917]